MVVTSNRRSVSDSANPWNYLTLEANYLGQHPSHHRSARNSSRCTALYVRRPLTVRQYLCISVATPRWQRDAEDSEVLVAVRPELEARASRDVERDSWEQVGDLPYSRFGPSPDPSASGQYEPQFLNARVANGPGDRPR